MAAGAQGGALGRLGAALAGPGGPGKMAAPTEVVLATDAAGLLCNCAAWELHSGAALPGYRGGNCAARGLALLGTDHLLGAQLGKSYISVWELQRKVPPPPRPGRFPHLL